MSDLVADWKKWRRAERVLAVMGTLPMVPLPLGLLMTGQTVPEHRSQRPVGAET